MKTDETNKIASENSEPLVNPYANTTRIVSVLNNTGRTIKMHNPEHPNDDVEFPVGLNQLQWGNSVSIPHFHDRAIRFEGYGYLFRHYTGMHYTLGAPPARDNDGDKIFEHHYPFEGVFVSIGLFPDGVKVLHSVNQLHAIADNLSKAFSTASYVSLPTLNAFLGDPQFTRRSAEILENTRGDEDRSDLKALGSVSPEVWQKAYDTLTPEEKERLTSDTSSNSEEAIKILNAVAAIGGVILGGASGVVTIVAGIFALIPGGQIAAGVITIIAGVLAISAAVWVGLIELVVWLISIFDNTDAAFTITQVDQPTVT